MWLRHRNKETINLERARDSDFYGPAYNFVPHSDTTAKIAQKRGEYFVRYRLIFVIFLSVTLFFIGATAGLLIGKLVFDKETECKSSANWGEVVTQGGVQKPVLEAIVDMMKAENIMNNLK